MELASANKDVVGFVVVVVVAPNELPKIPGPVDWVPEDVASTFLVVAALEFPNRPPPAGLVSVDAVFKPPKAPPPPNGEADCVR